MPVLTNEQNDAIKTYLDQKYNLQFKVESIDGTIDNTGDVVILNSINLEIKNPKNIVKIMTGGESYGNTIKFYNKIDVSFAIGEDYNDEIVYDPYTEVFEEQLPVQDYTINDLIPFLDKMINWAKSNYGREPVVEPRPAQATQSIRDTLSSVMPQVEFIDDVLQYQPIPNLFRLYNGNADWFYKGNAGVPQGLFLCFTRNSASKAPIKMIPANHIGFFQSTNVEGYFALISNTYTKEKLEALSQFITDLSPNIVLYSDKFIVTVTDYVNDDPLTIQVSSRNKYESAKYIELEMSNGTDWLYDLFDAMDNKIEYNQGSFLYKPSNNSFSYLFGDGTIHSFGIKDDKSVVKALQKEIAKKANIPYPKPQPINSNVQYFDDFFVIPTGSGIQIAPKKDHPNIVYLDLTEGKTWLYDLFDAMTGFGNYDRYTLSYNGADNVFQSVQNDGSIHSFGVDDSATEHLIKKIAKHAKLHPKPQSAPKPASQAPQTFDFDAIKKQVAKIAFDTGYNDEKNEFGHSLSSINLNKKALRIWKSIQKKGATVGEHLKELGNVYNQAWQMGMQKALDKQRVVQPVKMAQTVRQTTVPQLTDNWTTELGEQITDILESEDVIGKLSDGIKVDNDGIEVLYRLPLKTVLDYDYSKVLFSFKPKSTGLGTTYKVIVKETVPKGLPQLYTNQTFNSDEPFSLSNFQSMFDKLKNVVQYTHRSKTYDLAVEKVKEIAKNNWDTGITLAPAQQAPLMKLIESYTPPVGSSYTMSESPLFKLLTIYTDEQKKLSASAQVSFDPIDEPMSSLERLAQEFETTVEPPQGSTAMATPVTTINEVLSYPDFTVFVSDDLNNTLGVMFLKYEDEFYVYTNDGTTFELDVSPNSTIIQRMGGTVYKAQTLEEDTVDDSYFDDDLSLKLIQDAKNAIGL